MSSEAAVSYAALILADAEIAISSDKILSLTKAAGLEVDSVSSRPRNERPNKHTTREKEGSNFGKLDNVGSKSMCVGC